MSDLKLRPISNGADVMSIEEFKNLCEDGTFIDYDGIGYFCTDDKQSEIETIPSEIVSLHNNIPDGMTKVTWFNR